MMKWLWIVLPVVVAVISAVFGLMACADPEGRGGKMATRLFEVSAVSLTLAITILIALG